jgi:hypothetical protein
VTVVIDTSVLAGSAATGIEEPFALSVVTVGELRLGILSAGTHPIRAARLARLTAILEPTTVLRWTMPSRRDTRSCAQPRAGCRPTGCGSRPPRAARRSGGGCDQ